MHRFQCGYYVTFDRMNRSLVLSRFLKSMDERGYDLIYFYVNEKRKRIEIVYGAEKEYG